jgi:hypothetical protein
MNFQLQGNNITATKERTPLSRIMLVSIMTTMMFLVLVSAAPASSSILSFQQQAEASAYGLGERVPPAYIVIDGKPSRLQLENSDPLSGEDRTADYSRPAQGTISFGERFQLLVPQVPSIFKDVQSAGLTVCSDEGCGNDDFHISKELVNVRDTRFLYVETHLIDAPGGGHPDALGDGFTASEVGFKIFLFWTISFTDGTDQTYLAIVHLKGDPCEEHGWDDHPNTDTTCVDLDA